MRVAGKTEIGAAGRLEDTTFGVIFRALTSRCRSARVELQRAQVKKTVELHRGVPTECHSNLLHETLSHHFIERGLLSRAQANEYVASSAERGLLLGEVLVDERLLDADELDRSLRRNLVQKILECFTWESGSYRVVPIVPERLPASHLDVSTLTFTGLNRFAPDVHVRAEVARLMGAPLRLTAAAPEVLAPLSLPAPHRIVVGRLHEQFEVERSLLDLPGGMSRDEAMRLLFALSVLGVIENTSANTVELSGASPDLLDEDIERALGEVALPDEPEASAEAPPTEEDRRAESREILAEFHDCEGKDACELLGVSPDATPAEVRRCYVALCKRYAPERFEAPDMRTLADAADVLLAATIRAYDQLTRERSVPAQFRGLGDAPPADDSDSPAVILLTDVCEMAEDYALLGRKRLADGNHDAAEGLFAMARRADPANQRHRVATAYSAGRKDHDAAEGSLIELEAIASGSPDDPYVHLCAAALCHETGDASGAARHFREGCQAWAQGQPPNPADG